MDILAEADLQGKKLLEKEIIIKMEPYVKKDRPEKDFDEKEMQSTVNKSLGSLVKKKKIERDASNRYSLCETELPKENIKSRIKKAITFIDKRPKRISANTYVIEVRGDLIETRNLFLDYFDNDVYEIFPHSFGYLFFVFRGNKERINKTLNDLKEVMK